MNQPKHHPTEDRANGKGKWPPHEENASQTPWESTGRLQATSQPTRGAAVFRGYPTQIMEQLGRSKLVQWMLTYLAMAWLVLQLVQTLGEIWPLPISFQRGVSVVLGFLFFPAAVISWFHGERGRQKVCPLELTLLGAMLAMAVAAVWSLGA